MSQERLTPERLAEIEARHELAALIGALPADGESATLTHFYSHDVGDLLAELSRRPTPEQVAADKEQAVKEAVADVLRQMRWPLIETSETARMETVLIDKGRNMEIRSVNECADAQAHRYHVDLGPWPEYSTEF